jgi:hypothetical protein
MKRLTIVLGATLLMTGAAFAQSEMSAPPSADTNAPPPESMNGPPPDSMSPGDRQLYEARKQRAQAGTMSNGSGAASDTRQDTMSTSPSGQGRNDPTNPAASGASAGSPKNY